MINYSATVYAADLAHGFGKKPRDTIGIPAFFACAMPQIHRRIWRQAMNQRFLNGERRWRDLNSVTFGEKLNFLKTMLRLTDGEIGDGVNMDGSLVCRWRSGDRTLDRYKDSPVVERLAKFLLKRTCLQKQQERLALILSLSADDVEAESRACVDALSAFLYDGKAVRAFDSGTPGHDESPEAFPVSPNSVSLTNAPPAYIGMQGVTDALVLLESNLSKLTERSNTEITVYLSLQHARLPYDETAGSIWDMLCRMNGGRPVRVVFDNWLNDGNDGNNGNIGGSNSDDRVSRNLEAILPFLQIGKIQLHMIKSTQKFFYYNITFFAKGAGMVITTEPAGSMGVSISIMAESADYVSGMGAVFADFDRMSKSLARHVGGTKDEASSFSRLFDSSGDLQNLSGGISLLYMDGESYLALLKLNDIKGSQRQYRHTKFIEDKQRFETFLERHRIKEILSLPALDRLITEQKIQTPDLSFHEGEIKANEAIVLSLLNGLLAYIERYKNLSIYLERGEEMNPAFTCRIKGDTFVLLHSVQNSNKDLDQDSKKDSNVDLHRELDKDSNEDAGREINKDVNRDLNRDVDMHMNHNTSMPGIGKNHAVYSDNWMIVYEYIKQFGKATQSESLMTTKSAVTAALQLRIEKTGGI